jgi:3-hydroxyisobutyrate dehydrogenase-like beta-hydroxyacid dehydrogenase
MKVGFIGLGRMGSAMAENLIKAGHDVTVFNRTPGRSHTLLALGAHEATCVADACQGEVVITMLSDDTAVADVALVDNGLIANLAEGAIHVSMSSIGVDFSKRLAQAHSRASQHYVAAPVLGRPDMAAAAKLFIVAAGNPTAIDRCRPLLDAMGQKTLPIGEEAWMANLVKLSSNFLQGAVIEALGEAIALISKAGIDRHAYVDLLTSTAFTAPAYRIFGGLIADDNFEPALFAAPLGYKDIRLWLAAAEGQRVPMPIASLLHDRFLRLFAQGGDRLDWAAIGRLAAQDADVVHA